MDDTDLLLNDAGYRRRWLLSKALEGDIPLAKALQLAQAAEEFLMGIPSRAIASDWLSQLEVPRSSDRPNDDLKEIATMLGALDGLSSVATIPGALDALSSVAPKAGALDGFSSVATKPGALDGLSSVVTMDDVVRYIRNGGETVVLETGGKFLINGCSTENAEGLLARANRMRTRERLPRFELLPGPNTDKAVTRHKSATPGTAAVRRPPSARERAEWARQALVLPA
jgi:hypothetical protein